jgi:hypothetical protein
MENIIALAHFKPFSVNQLLLAEGESFDEVFAQFEFSMFNTRILENWEALHECEDERDAERMKKQLSAQKAAKALTHSMKTIDSTDLLEIDETSSAGNTGQTVDPKVQSLLQSLVVSEWLHPKSDQDIARIQVTTQSFSSSMIKDLKKQLKESGKSFLRSQRTAANVSENMLSDAFCFQLNNDGEAKTESLHDTESLTSTTPEAVLTQVSTEWKLNEKQNIAFEIIAQSYFEVLEARAKNIPKADQPQLRMLMSGPGGVGKTYVVRAVQKVMELYGAAHKIKFTAPLGSCAALIK